MENDDSAKPNKERVRSGLNSGLDVLDSIAAAAHPLSMTEIAQHVGMAKSSVNQLLATLHQRGLVRRLDDQRYVIGLRAWEIGCRSGPVEFARLALPHMARLASDISEGVALGLPEHAEVVCIQLVESPNAVRVHNSIGDRTPVHCGSSGLAYLATLPVDEVTQLLPETLAPMTEQTLTSRAALLEELDRVRARGYAVARGAWRAEVAGLAIALLGADARAAAVLNVAVPLHRLTPDWIDAVLPRFREAAAAIQAEFGAHHDQIAAHAPRGARRGAAARAPSSSPRA